MRVTEVVARAFGPFHGERLDLAPGMTVVAGPNEAGKSTWHAALRLALTGLRRGRGRSTSADAALAEQHRPWDGPDGWEVGAGLVLDDGRTIELRQDLDGKVACSALDVGLGRDVSSEILDGTPDASRWLGLDRDAFAVTISVSQADVMAVTGAAGQLQEQMQRAAATRGTDATAAEAIERLADFRREAVGADIVNAKGPLRVARLRQAAAIERREAAAARHLELLEEQARAEEAARRVDDARLNLDLALAGRARQLAHESDRRARRAAELAQRYPHRPTLTSREERADLVAAALTEWERRPLQPKLEGPSSEMLEADLQRVPPPPVGDTAPHSAVVGAVGDLDLADQAMGLLGEAPAVDEGIQPGDEARLRTLARRLRAGHVEPATQGESRQQEGQTTRSRLTGPRLLIAALALIAAGCALAILGQSLVGLAVGGAGMVLGGFGLAHARLAGSPGSIGDSAYEAIRLAAAEARRDAEAAAREAQRDGLPVDIEALDALADRALLAVRDREQAASWHASRADLTERLTVAQDALRQALAGRDAPTEGDLRAAWLAYRTACEERAAQAMASRRGETLRAQLAARRLEEETAVAAARATTDAERRLRAAVEIAEIANAGESADELAAALRAWQHERAAALQANQTAIEEWRELETLLGTGRLADLAREAEQRGRAASELAARLPDMAAEPAVGQDLELLIEERRQALAALEAEAGERRGSLESLGRNPPEVAEAEEAVAAASSELARVEASARTIDETLRLLRLAQERVHRDLAPILAGVVRRWLPAVSGGAYEDVTVDPADLSVQVKEAQAGIWRQARLLSEGTREQIYLLLRVAMAQHLVTTGESAPLILDEVTAQSDGERRAVLLSVLHQLSAERQVILFSHDPEVAAWAERHLAAPNDLLVRLPSLTLQIGARRPGRRKSIAIAVEPAKESATLAG